MNYRGNTFAILLLIFCLFRSSIFAQNPGTKLYNKGIEHFEYARYDSALNSLNNAGKYFISKKDITNWLKTRIALADVYHEIAQYDSCNSIVEYIEIQLNKLPKTGELQILLNSYCVNHYCVFANISQATEYLSKLDKLMTGIKDSDLIQKYLFNNYQLCYLKGDYNKAMQYIDSAIAGSNRKILLAKYFVFKQLIAYRQTNFGEQTRYLQRCGELVNELKIPYHWINAKLNEGYAYWNLDLTKYDLCLEFNKKSYAILRKLYQEYHPEIANVYNQLGISFNSDDDSSIYCHRQALKIRKKIFGEDNFMCSYSYNNLGNMLKKKKDLDSAVWYYQKAIKIREKELGLHHPKMANSYLKMCDLFMEKKDYKNIIKYAQYALCASMPEYSDTSEYMKNPAIGKNIYPRETLVALNKKEYALYTMAYNEKNDSIQTGLLLKTFDCIEKIDTLIMNLFVNGFDYDENSYSLNYNQSYPNFNRTYHLYLKTGDKKYLNEAFKIIDANKSSSLFQQFSMNESKMAPDISYYMADKINRFNVIKKLISNDISLAERDSLKLLDKKLNDKLLKSETALRQSHPECYYLLKGRNKLDVQEIQNKLPDKTAVLYLCLMNGRIAKLFFFRDIILPMSEQLTGISKETVQIYRTMIEKNMDLDTSFFNAGYQLYRLYFPKDIDSVLESRNIQNLIIVSDVEAWTIPFESLLTKEVKERPVNLGDFPFLIKKYNISYSPSLYFVYHSLCQKPAKTFENDILLVAPVFNNRQIALARTSTRAYIESLIKSEPENVSLENSIMRGNNITALPYTEIEVNGIDKEFRGKHQKTKVLLNENASYGKVLQSLKYPYRIVHFATHGIANMGFPDLSGIILANDTSGNEDILFAGDLSTTLLSADLVVLSACETAYGKVIFGDGIYNLAHSFAAQGVPNVMASLWKVADKSTSLIMLDFYNDLLKTRFASYSESLRRAKLKMLEEGKYDHPYYWAPFVYSRY